MFWEMSIRRTVSQPSDPDRVTSSAPTATPSGISKNYFNHAANSIHWKQTDDDEDDDDDDDVIFV